MTLRLRLVVATMAVTIPMGLLLLWFDTVRQHAVAEQRLAGSVAARMPMERDRCEAAPESFGGELPPPFPPGRGAPPPGRGAPPGRDGPPGPPGPPPRAWPPPPRSNDHEHARTPEIFAYDENLHSQNPRAPAISTALARGIRAGDVAAEPFAWGSSNVEVLVAMPWHTGPCAYVRALGTTDPKWGILPDSNLWLLPTVGVFAAMLLALGPVIRRIRQLTAAVHQSASNAYASEIAADGRDEIGELARTFNAARAEIRSQLAQKDKREQALRHFLANTTHDVMIPLTVLQGHLAWLREQEARGEPLDSHALVSAMSEAHYMASLVHNLGAVARLDASETSEETMAEDVVDLNDLVVRVVARHRPIARELGVSLESAVPSDVIHVWGDVTLIEQAASNVTYNAIRYNRSGGHVAVILEQTSRCRFSLRVIDDGPGIPEGERARLAERGVRGNEARTRAPEGQGLGLHIAYRAAKLHEFELTLEASEYGGLEVKIQGATTLGDG